MAGAYRTGLGIGRMLSGARRLLERSEDRVTLALYDLDDWLVRRTAAAEARIAELKEGVDDWRKVDPPL